MSSEVLDRKPAFKMPEPARGQVVMFYPNGVVSAANMQLGTVTRITRNNIEITTHGVLRDGVRHKDDPTLKTNKHAKTFGCWEFTDRDVQMVKLIVRLDDLEKTVARLLNKK